MEESSSTDRVVQKGKWLKHEGLIYRLAYLLCSQSNEQMRNLHYSSDEGIISLYEPAHEILVLIALASNEDSGECQSF